jgi:hypothetical protein
MEIPSALVITKSTNRNEVHYAVQVDGGCAPSGQTPVWPYWQMLESSPLATEPLSASEQRVLGLAHQEVSGDTVQIALRAMASRAITIRTWRASDGRCASSAEMTIAGTRAVLAAIHVKLTLFGVDYVLLSGRTPEGAPVEERMSL